MRKLPLLFMIILAGCVQPRLEEHVWNLVDVGGMLSRTDLTTYIRLFRGGTYTARVEGVFRYGSWERRGDTLVLDGVGEPLLQYRIMRQLGYTLVVRAIGPEASQQDLTFEAGVAAKDSAEDAYSLANSRWQIRANHPESDQEIMNRVKSHLYCQFLYVKAALDQDVSTLSLTQFPSPIAFYGNGLELMPLDKAPDEWKNTFYDSAEMATGYQMLKSAFNSQIDIPNTKNTFILYKAILSGLYANVH